MLPLKLGFLSSGCDTKKLLKGAYPILQDPLARGEKITST